MSWFPFFNKRSTVDVVHPKDPALAKLFLGLGGPTDSGVNVTADNAPEVATVMACVRVLAETMGCLPFIMYRRLDGDDRERATDHPLYNLLRYQPNAWQTWQEFIEMMVAHIGLRGNSYAEIDFGNDGRIAGLIPLHPDRTDTFLVNGQRAFRHTPLNGPARTLLQHEVFYVPGLTLDGVKGVDPIGYARNTIGLARVTEMYGGRFFANDARPAIILKHPKTLSDAAYKNIIDSWVARHQGAARSHRPALLEEGMDIQEIGVDPDNAQFLETRKHQRDEICGMFRVPPHMIGNLDKATFSNIEHQSRGFVDYTMLPWFTRFELAARRDLFTKEEKKKYYLEFLPDALLRGDLKSRSEAYAIGRNWGWLSVNDIRRKENMNLVKGGDIYLQPLNMQDAGQPILKVTGEGGKSRGLDLLPVLGRAAERVVRKEINAIRKAEERGGADEGIEAFYAEHRDFVRNALGISERSAEKWCNEQRAKILNAKNKGEMLDLWEVEATRNLVSFTTEELSNDA